MRRFVIVSFMALALVSCSAAERQRTLADIGAYVGAPAHPDGSLARDAAGQPIYDGVPDYDPVEVAASAAKSAAASATTTGPYGLIAWILGGVGAVGLGWYKRKFLIEQAKNAVGKVSNFGEPIGGDSSAPVDFSGAASAATGGPGGFGGAGGTGGQGGSGSIGSPGLPGQPGGTGGAGGSGGAAPAVK